VLWSGSFTTQRK